MRASRVRLLRLAMGFGASLFVAAIGLYLAVVVLSVSLNGWAAMFPGPADFWIFFISAAKFGGIPALVVIVWAEFKSAGSLRLALITGFAAGVWLPLMLGAFPLVAVTGAVGVAAAAVFWLIAGPPNRAKPLEAQ